MKKIYLGLMVVILILGAMLTGCSSKADQSNATGKSVSDLSTSQAQTSEQRTINIDKLEIYHFHGTHQCTSCTAVGALAEATVNTYFKDELDKGIIVFDHINGDLPENRDLVMKYGATGSSLWLGTYKDGNFKAEENVNVWYKIRDKQAYMDYLKGVIEQKLAGN